MKTMSLEISQLFLQAHGQLLLDSTPLLGAIKSHLLPPRTVPCQMYAILHKTLTLNMANVMSARILQNLKLCKLLILLFDNFVWQNALCKCSSEVLRPRVLVKYFVPVALCKCSSEVLCPRVLVKYFVPVF
jgi:hypothetical protein